MCLHLVSLRGGEAECQGPAAGWQGVCERRTAVGEERFQITEDKTVKKNRDSVQKKMVALDLSVCLNCKTALGESDFIKECPLLPPAGVFCH